MGFVMSVIRGILLTIFVVLCPLSLTNLLEYLKLNGFELPWFIEIPFVPMLTFLTLLLITFLFKVWYVIQECPKKKKDWGGIFWASVWGPFLAMAGSLVINFIPFLKAPLFALEVLGEIIHPFFSKVPEGMTFLPGHFVGVAITSMFGKWMLGC